MATDWESRRTEGGLRPGGDNGGAVTGSRAPRDAERRQAARSPQGGRGRRVRVALYVGGRVVNTLGVIATGATVRSAHCKSGSKLHALQTVFLIA